jgi:hypothetical protein
MKMDKTELAAWINNAAVKYECDLDDGVSERTAADNFINNVLNILVKAGNGIIASNNNEIYSYTE